MFIAAHFDQSCLPSYQSGWIDLIRWRCRVVDKLEVGSESETVHWTTLDKGLAIAHGVLFKRAKAFEILGDSAERQVQSKADLVEQGLHIAESAEGERGQSVAW
jgi:hypothetical protein